MAPTFWTGMTGKKIRKTGRDAQVLAAYLLTSPHANMYGLYYLPVPFICHEVGFTEKGALKALQSLKEVGFCDYDQETEHVWVYEMAFYQIADSLKEKDNRVKGINDAYAAMPANPFLYAFYEKYKDAFLLEKSRGQEGAYKPPLSQEQEQEQEQKKDSSMSENKFSDEDMKLAEYIFAKVRELLPKAKKPNYKKWAGCIRLMRERDNRTHEEIQHVFDWANNDHFWQTNIRSPEKLREKFDELEIKMKNSGGNNGTTGKTSTVQRVRDKNPGQPPVIDG